MRKLLIRTLSSILVIIILTQNVAVFNYVKAEEETNSQINMSNGVCSQGDYTYLYLNATNLLNLAALELNIYYDADAFELISTSADYLSTGAETVINNSNQGEIKFNLISLDGITGSGSLMYICLKAKQEAEVKTYPITLAIGEAYDINLQPVSIEGVNGSIVVNKSIVPLKALTFYGYADKSSGYIGDEIIYTFYCSDWKLLAAGNFVLTYNADLFDFVSLDLSDGIAKPDAIYSINTDTKGMIKVSYAGVTGIVDFQSFILKLKIKANVNIETSVLLSADSLYDENLVPLGSNNLSINTEIIEKEIIPDYPDIRFDVIKIDSDNSYKLTLIMQGASKIAAGDFTITYDKDIFDCISVKEHNDVTLSNSMVVVNPDTNNGSIKFSFVNVNGISEDTKVLVIELKSKINYNRTTTVSIAGTDVVDSLFNNVQVDCIDTVINTDIPMYTVTWDVDGVITTESYEYGTLPSFKGSTDKTATTQYTYTFAGWDKEITEVTEDVTFVAVYESVVNKYTVTWDVDGIITTEEYEYGTLPSFKGSTDKTATKQYTYTFAGYDKEIYEVTEEITYVAVYESVVNKYTVTWDVDGIITTEEYEYGTLPSFKGTTDKTATAQYSYTFAGWDKDITEVTEDVTYVAIYEREVNKYTVTWDIDGVITTEEYEYGSFPSFKGTTYKEPDEEHIYTFIGWDKSLTQVIGDVTYIAQYTSEENVFTVTWDVDGVITIEGYIHGTIPSYKGTTDKTGNAQYKYTFLGWDKEITEVTDNVTYVAVYESVVNKYTVTWNVDGVITTEEYEYGTMPNFKGITDKAPEGDLEYTFTGWDNEIGVVTGNQTYVALYSSKDIKAPLVTGVTNNSYYNTDVTIDFNEGTATLNGLEFISGSKVTEEGTYVLIVTDNEGNKTEVTFYIDKSTPVISVKDKDNNEIGNGQVTDKEVTLTYSDANIDTVIVTLNGNPIDLKDSYSSIGKYVISIIDKAGNKIVFAFEIKVQTITSSKYSVKENEKTISKITTGTAISQFLSNVNEGMSIKVFKDNTEVSGNTLIGTGMVVKLIDGDTVISTYAIVVTGDINGDGNSSLTDFVVFKSYFLGKQTLTGAFQKAADLNGDGNVSLTDFVEYKSVLLGKKDIVAH